MITRNLLPLGLVLLLLASGPLQAQSGKSNENARLTWLGIDFSASRLIGDSGVNPADFRDRYTVGINNVVLDEPDKYDLPKAFRRDTVDKDLAYVTAMNATLDTDRFLSPNERDYKRFNRDSIASLVARYDFTGASGTGVLFVVESMSKPKAMAAIWVVFVDLPAGTVTRAERMEGSAKGFGLRNYWVHPVNDILKSWRSRN